MSTYLSSFSWLDTDQQLEKLAADLEKLALTRWKKELMAGEQEQASDATAANERKAHRERLKKTRSAVLDKTLKDKHTAVSELHARKTPEAFSGPDAVTDVAKAERIRHANEASDLAKQHDKTYESRKQVLDSRAAEMKARHGAESAEAATREAKRQKVVKQLKGAKLTRTPAEVPQAAKEKLLAEGRTAQSAKISPKKVVGEAAPTPVSKLVHPSAPPPAGGSTAQANAMRQANTWGTAKPAKVPTAGSPAGAVGSADPKVRAAEGKALAAANKAAPSTSAATTAPGKKGPPVTASNASMAGRPTPPPPPPAGAAGSKAAKKAAKRAAAAAAAAAGGAGAAGGAAAGAGKAAEGFGAKMLSGLKKHRVGAGIAAGAVGAGLLLRNRNQPQGKTINVS